MTTHIKTRLISPGEPTLLLKSERRHKNEVDMEIIFLLFFLAIFFCFAANFVAYSFKH